MGHGGGAFTWRQAVPAHKQGFKADVISSDLHTQSMNSGMKNMNNLISKFMALDVSLFDAISRVTWVPAKVINRKDLGHMSIDAEADITVFKIRKGDFGFLDVRRIRLQGNKKLETALTLRAGKIVWDLNGLGSENYK